MLVMVIGDRMPGLKPLSHWIGPTITALTMTSSTRVRLVIAIDHGPRHPGGPGGGRRATQNKAA
jgi:hypothetical protein